MSNEPDNIEHDSNQPLAKIEVPILDRGGKQVDTITVDPADLGGHIRFALLKQAYVITHGNQRQGSARTKSRGRVAGSTRKLYKQKGTGNARSGPVRTPIRIRLRPGNTGCAHCSTTQATGSPAVGAGSP